MSWTLQEWAGIRRLRLLGCSPRIAVLSGPASSEDRLYYSVADPDLLSHHDIAASLRRLGAAQVDILDLSTGPGWTAGLPAYDLVVVNLHGQPGEDGSIQGLLQTLGIPFVGSPVEASVIGLNKLLTKLLAQQADVRTPRFGTHGSTMGGRCPDNLCSGERIAKRLRGGSSIDMLRLGPREPPPPQADWLVEEYVDGADATVTVVEGAGDVLALPAVVLDFDHSRGHGSYDTDAKLLRPRADRARGVRPAEMGAALAECERIAATMHTAVGARHISRCDFRVRDGEAYFLEINTLPGLSAVSNCTECAHAGGLSYDDLIALVVGAALP